MISVLDPIPNRNLKHSLAVSYKRVKKRRENRSKNEEYSVIELLEPPPEDWEENVLTEIHKTTSEDSMDLARHLGSLTCGVARALGKRP